MCYFLLVFKLINNSIELININTISNVQRNIRPFKDKSNPPNINQKKRTIPPLIFILIAPINPNPI